MVSVTLKKITWPKNFPKTIPIAKSQEGAFIYSLANKGEEALKCALNSIQNLALKTDFQKEDIPTLLYINKHLISKIPSYINFPEENLIIIEDHLSGLPKNLADWCYFTNLTQFGWVCELKDSWLIPNNGFRLAFRLKNAFRTGHILLGLPYNKKITLLRHYKEWYYQLEQIDPEPCKVISSITNIPLDVVEDIFLTDIYGSIPRGIAENFVAKVSYFGPEFLDWVSSLPKSITNNQLILTLWILKEQFSVSVFKDLICTITFCNTDQQLVQLIETLEANETIDIKKAKINELRKIKASEQFIELVDKEGLEAECIAKLAKRTGIEFTNIEKKKNEQQLLLN